jgi:hypothetical protein
MCLARARLDLAGYGLLPHKPGSGQKSLHEEEEDVP